MQVRKLDLLCVFFHGSEFRGVKDLLIWSPVSTLVPTLRSDGGRVNTDGD